jgi:C4-dicarboxylate transporter DctQ subunit
MAALLRLVDVIAWVSSALARLLLVFIAFSLVTQVILRFGFGRSLPWPEEAARYLMIWMVMLSAGRLIRNNELVRVDFLDMLWPGKLLMMRDILFRVCMIALFVIVAYEGWEQAAFASRRLTAATQVSWFWPYLAIPVGAVLIIIELLAVSLREILSMRDAGQAAPVQESAQ